MSVKLHFLIIHSFGKLIRQETVVRTHFWQFIVFYDRHRYHDELVILKLWLFWVIPLHCIQALYMYLVKR